MSEKFEAIVVGAGPAGSACSYTLAKAGVQTLLVERGKFPGAKNMWGGVFYGPILNQLFPRFWQEAPVERFIVRHRFSLLTSDSLLSSEFFTKKFSQPPYHGFSLLRSKFDRWLAAKAEKAGAIVASGLKVDDLLWEKNKVAGIKAGRDEIPAEVVIACDGVNSFLAEKAGLRNKFSPRELKQAVKEVIQLSPKLIEQRFNLKGEEGLAWEFIGSFTQGVPGGAFIYTNKDSLSVGVVVQLSGLAEKKLKADDLLEEFKNHPQLKPFLVDGNLAEYSAHLIPAAGPSKLHSLYSNGFLVAGDAALLVLTTGLIIEGANLALASGEAAAQAVIRAKEKGDYSSRTLSLYPRLLKENSVLEDLNNFRRAYHFLENPRLYQIYPELACELAFKILSHEERPRKKGWKLAKEAAKGRVSWWQVIKDLKNLKDSL